MNWGLVRPIGMNENRFDGSLDAVCRIQGWDFLMSGGALYNNLDHSFAVGHEDGTFRVPENASARALGNGHHSAAVGNVSPSILVS